MFWTREIIGWICIATGLFLFYVSYFGLLRNGYIVESGPTVIMGFVVFRGGIHLLKVAVAARICRQAPIDEKAKAKPEAVRPQRRTVVPGKR